MSQWQQFWRDWIDGATHLTSIGYSWSALGAIFLGNVLGGFPIITEMDEDALNGDHSVLQFFPSVNNNRVHDASM